MDDKDSSREGMALLTVLLLVAVMAAVCVLILDDVRFAVRRTSNAEHQTLMQSYAAIAETAAGLKLAGLVQADVTRTPVYPAWNGIGFDQDVEGARVRVTVRDGQACFNLNSLVFGQGEDLMPQPEGARQFIELGSALGIGRQRMAALAEALTDWMDSDQIVSGAGGAEDSFYGQQVTPYRTAGLMLAEVSELRAIKGFDAQAYDVLRPFVCALPEARLSRINLNTMDRDDAPVLVALGEGRLTLEAARAALSGRPADGWPAIEAFWAQPTLNGVVADEQLRSQTTLSTRYFDVQLEVQAEDSRAHRMAQIHVNQEGVARTIIRRWTTEE